MLLQIVDLIAYVGTVFAFIKIIVKLRKAMLYQMDRGMWRMYLAMVSFLTACALHIVCDALLLHWPLDPLEAGVNIIMMTVSLFVAIAVLPDLPAIVRRAAERYAHMRAELLRLDETISRRVEKGDSTMRELSCELRVIIADLRTRLENTGGYP